MALPTEAQTLIDLLQRRGQLAARRNALQADEQDLEQAFLTLFLSGALGVNENNRFRVIHLRTQGGRVRLLFISWIGLVNGVNQADAQIVEVQEEVPGPANRP